MEVGLRSLFDFHSFVFGMALIRAIFHADGNLEMQLLRICVRVKANCSEANLTYFTGILSGPKKQSLLNPFNSVSTS